MPTEKIKNIFLSNIIKTNSCWIWNRALNLKGYGKLWVQLSDTSRKLIEVHRFSWMLHNGDIPDGLFVCHKCDNRACVNPDHLFLGTHQDNMDDMVKKGRSRSPGSDPEKQKILILESKTPEAIAKKKETFKGIKHQQGNKNSQYGTMWITNGTDNKKIPKELIIPMGWYNGRVIKKA